ncbi:Acetyltransferase (GNAT) family protein [Micromonospora rhizosphaerae]|uniref:Acetyltransferase (GNAT) family protein n=1 Tax=Micromonospora rhizosphaerae TaxID=568872 RepID=A0A1C6S1X9_9ACTN|nr:GNAT family N-acetyltransferase [Micromonospora rhizosphaerae]SCL23489.1 Acetyltransferase (GNAT) family protein [Micromonospora rhizosphaerae]
MDVELRVVRSDDAARLAALLTQLGYPVQEPEVTERLTYWFGDPASLLIGADVRGDLAGVAALHVIPMLEATGRWARLAALVVDERYRGKGVGRSLVEAAETRAREMGCRYMEIASSRRRVQAHRFYRSLGYEDVCERSARFIKYLLR